MTARSIALALAVVASSARADPTAAELNAQAKQEFAAGDYGRAAATFEAAYASEPDLAYLFDAAQAYRLDKQCGKAATAYRAFLDAADHPPNEATVRKYLAQVEACAAAEKPVEPPPPPVDTPPVAPSAVEPPRVEPRVEPAHERPAPAPRSHNVELALAAGAIVSLAVAIGFTYDVAALEISREQLCARPCTWDLQKQALSDELQSRGDRATAIAVTSYVFAGLAAGAGVAVYFVRRHRAEARVSAAPRPGGALVVASGRF